MPIPQLSEVTDEQIQEIAQRFLEQGATFKELKGIADEELEAVYAVGHNLFVNGKYDDAENAFRFLCFFDHLNKKHWLGLGACRKAKQNYAGAVDAFGLAGVLDLRDPRAALQSAECHLQLGKREEALSALNAILAYSDESQWSAIRQRATMMLQMLSAPAKAD